MVEGRFLEDIFTRKEKEAKEWMEKKKEDDEGEKAKGGVEREKMQVEKVES